MHTNRLDTTRLQNNLTHTNQLHTNRQYIMFIVIYIYVYIWSIVYIFILFIFGSLVRTIFILYVRKNTFANPSTNPCAKPSVKKPFAATTVESSWQAWSRGEGLDTRTRLPQTNWIHKNELNPSMNGIESMYII